MGDIWQFPPLTPLMNKNTAVAAESLTGCTQSPGTTRPTSTTGEGVEKLQPVLGEIAAVQRRGAAVCVRTASPGVQGDSSARGAFWFPEKRGKISASSVRWAREECRRSWANSAGRQTGSCCLILRS